MTNHDSDIQGDEWEAYEAYLLEETQRHAATVGKAAATNAIWNAMRAELRAEGTTEAVSPFVINKTVGSYFTFRNLLALAAVGFVVSISSVIIVAVQQRRDGTVISTVTHVERLMRRGRVTERTRLEWLPEEREIWKQLLGQAEQGTDGTQAVAWEQ